MINYEALREMAKNHPKYNGCVEIERAPLITPGFPGTFNLSFSEDEWLKEYGRYIEFDHDHIFTTVQSCVRPQDFDALQTQQSWKYLGVFELADLTGMITLAQRPDYAALQRKQASILVEFLGKVGITPDRIHPSYSSGGTVRLLSDGKYNFDFNIPKDELSRKAFLEAGIPENNLIEDSTRDTFLCLHIHRPTEWGYRNEINVNVGTKRDPRLLDIATIEYLVWKPIFGARGTEAKDIITLVESTDGVSISAVGLERVCLAANGLIKVQNVDYIKPVYDILGGENALVESVRALHRICTDMMMYNISPSRHQKGKMKKLIRNTNDTDEKAIREALTAHAETQPWHNTLKEGIDPTIETICRYRRNSSNP